MFLIHLLCVGIIIGFGDSANSPVRLSSIKVKLLPTEDDHDFDKELSEVNQRTDKAYAVSNFINQAVLPSVISKLSGDVLIVLNLIDSIMSENFSMERKLTDTILDEVERRSALEKIKTLQNSLKSIEKQFDLIDFNDQKVSERNIPIIRGRLFDITTELDSQDTILKKYPELTVQYVLAVGSFYSNYYPIEKKITPTEATWPTVPCEISSTLEDFRDLYVYSRLKKITGLPIIGTSFYFYYVCKTI